MEVLGWTPENRGFEGGGYLKIFFQMVTFEGGGVVFLGIRRDFMGMVTGAVQ